MKINYWVVQHIEDVFRNEPRNIGVFVKRGTKCAAKFLGESGNAVLDKRKTKNFKYPDVYSQWVSFWRNELNGEKTMDEIVRSSGDNYRVVESGFLTGTEGDSLNEILEYLYTVLVSEGGIGEAISPELEAETAIARLESDVESTLQNANLIDEVFYRHPVRQRVPVTGSMGNYNPKFVQQNGTLYVMETVDLTSTKISIAKDHAIATGYMFQDIRKKHSNAEGVAIVKYREEDIETDEVALGLSVLRGESKQVVNWLKESEKTAFLEERKKVGVMD